jgi:hypothetical protein
VAKGRYVLRYRGEGVVPEADVTRVQELPGAVVVDSSAKMLVVEADAEPLRALVEGLPEWVLAPEQVFVVPDVRQKIERPPT